jgi:hypothetical protein
MLNAIHAMHMAAIVAADPAPDSGMFQVIVDLYKSVVPSVIVVLLLVGGVMTMMKLLKGGQSGGLKEAGMTAGMYVLAALVLVSFYALAPKLVGSIADTTKSTTNSGITVVAPE